MTQRYPIPAKTTRTEIIIKRSRFIATISFADTVEVARAFIQTIRDEMPDATHHVYAFRVGYGSSVNEGLSDDGEPAGTSGKPTMAVLRGADLGDAVLVITRYFGGTKLGTGGLVRAYSSAAKEALEHLSVIEKVERLPVTLEVAYSNYELVKRLLPDYQTRILHEDFADHITFTLSVPEDLFDTFSVSIRELSLHNTAPVVSE
ncbi:YigZ family protein [candidate division KSB3 bacterium]|uniref:YigZ family protein n=1 Tax=candidate division KSB3 bacterium TaxID=2044937 RepID=A0A2G6KI03_9BACT|nr:MAG: YigZ family protein [candidate division KSB3 bacterium]